MNNELILIEMRPRFRLCFGIRWIGVIKEQVNKWVSIPFSGYLE